MNTQASLISRNRQFAATFDKSELSILPELRTVLLTCADARVDPAHVLGLELGEAAVIRNNGGRVTRSVIEEIATLAVMVDMLTDGREPGFTVVLMQHTQCGAQRLADPALQEVLRNALGIDVSESAITDQPTDLMEDIRRLCEAEKVPDAIAVSAMLYDVASGTAREIAPARTLADWRADLER